ncbi:enoyl-CoA hydratase/isomerase family protein [Thauera linaloolentis]|uniref:Enoyl-CoA hydratase/isomerase n=1 Tax=Thauera linaloolentis (strain DSM 12138 / JCM 21573 / CCUG 41526 / CIP 105981 / IAM 15112 / NBRC 102519 / 47Lol) TaxID=1123367 RepID=N6XTN0_THAL4|nr:enoyl-CoA hydratase-related protein [Thauera linaloolentis]ENO85101.1 enoyl-CoA hydratase/isomerase [Thauera linaloolentis 47Lol = DSM 12138]MCM8566713.1 enoyl-CoA hydratase-related protein [Thauera linaloolentis]
MTTPPASEAPLLNRRDGAVAHLRFNRPQVLNAIDAGMAGAFLSACKSIAGDASVRAVVISGEGRAFMAGGDIASFGEGPQAIADTLIAPMHEALQILAGLRAPVIASVQGAVAGAGMSLALACDLAIAADDARFNLAYVKLGTSCDLGASWNLPRIVGLRRALEIALLSDGIDAAEALRLGLVNKVVPAAALEAETQRLAARLADGAPAAQGMLKRLMRDALGHDFPAQLQAERQGFAACAATADFSEGVAAFLEKRPARYTGG